MSSGIDVSVLPKQPKEKVRIHDIEVVRTGTRITLPDGMATGDAIAALMLKQQSEEQDVNIWEEFDASPPEGAYALMQVLEEKYGMAMVQGDWLSNATMVTVQVGFNETVLVPWGNFPIPGVEAVIRTAGQYNPLTGLVNFRFGGTVKRKHEEIVRQLGSLVRERLRTHSIYQGKAFRLSFTDVDGDTIRVMEPQFLDLRQVARDELVFDGALGGLISTNLFTPVRHTEAVRRAGIPLKRGVCLAGTYGTGKTMTAYKLADECVRYGWTFIYLEHASELAQGIRFAAKYQPAVIFVEDVDKAVDHSRRSTELNDLLNTLDGVDTKERDIMVVFTTNHLEDIHPAMLRPGRLDAVIRMQPPSSVAAARLVQVYGRGQLAPDVNFDLIGRELDGHIPALIREVVERAKLGAIGRSGTTDFQLTTEDLVLAAHGLKEQRELLTPAPQPRQVSDIEHAAGVLAKTMLKIAGGDDGENQLNGQDHGVNALVPGTVEFGPTEPRPNA